MNAINRLKTGRGHALAMAIAALLALTAIGPAAPARADATSPDDVTLLLAQATSESCPSIKLSSSITEGAFRGIEVGDYAHLTLKLDNGQEEDFIAAGDVQDFDAPIGTRVRVEAEREQLFVPEAGECMVWDIAISIKKIK